MYTYLKKQQPRIIVLGATGQLGTEFINYLDPIRELNVLPVNSRQLDITKKEMIWDVLGIEVKKNDIIINCAAYNNVYGPETNDDEQKEIEKKKCFKANALGPKYLAKFCKKKKLKLVHFSTNYVFEDRRFTMKMYSEFDEVKPFLFYGFSKLCGENFIKELSNDKFLTLRTSWLFSKNGSLVKMIEDHIEKKKEIFVASAIGNPTYTLDVVKQTMVLLENRMGGMYHCVNEGTTTKKMYIEEVIKRLKPLEDINIKDSCPGPSMPLKNFMLNMEGLNQMRSWEEALEDCFKREAL